MLIVYFNNDCRTIHDVKVHVCFC